MDVEFGKIKCSSHSIPQQLDEIHALLKEPKLQPRLILTMNAHIFNMAYVDEELRSVMNSARTVTADGMAIVWASRLFQRNIPMRCNATDAFRAFLLDRTMPKNRGLLIGCSEDEVSSAKINIENSSNHCSIVATIDGYQCNETYKEIFAQYRDIDFIFLGMGTPKTEIIGEIAGRLCPNTIVWGIGGGTIKIFSNTMKEAPSTFKRIGLQWFFRLMVDPVRLWKRYLLGNPLFVARIIKIYFKNKLSNS